MSSDPFRLESPPRVEPRHRKARREVLARIADEHEDRDRRMRREPDHQAFRARAFFVVSGIDLIDAVDPLDGHTLASVVNLLAARVKAANVRQVGRAFWHRDLTVWEGGRLVATVRIGTDGRPEVQVHRPA
jgi:hypothetical protein